MKYMMTTNTVINANAYPAPLTTAIKQLTKVTHNSEGTPLYHYLITGKRSDLTTGTKVLANADGVMLTIMNFRTYSAIHSRNNGNNQRGRGRGRGRGTRGTRGSRGSRGSRGPRGSRGSRGRGRGRQ